MKSSKPSEFFRPFENLNALLKSRSFVISSSPEIRPPQKRICAVIPDEESRLFMDAMADVKPISGKNRIEKNSTFVTPIDEVSDNDSETLGHLNNLVRYGKGFKISDTPEYMEGRGYKIHPEITNRLHRGDYSIQGHIDLHGLSVKDARVLLEKFIKDSLQTGKRSILIVHGRGLSSPAQPILKTKVYEWLTRGSWRKWIIAFSSAQIYDGGAGATYVLLRQRPLTKRFRKKAPGVRP